MKRLVRRVDADLFILIETDFWYNLLTELKKNSTKIALVNGKLSENSYHNFSKVKPFAKALFAPIDYFCLQSEIDRERFLSLGSDSQKIHVTGNIKFDSPIVFSKRGDLHFPKTKNLVTIALTHENEEDLILNELEPLENLTFLLAPRHPERFQKISDLLKMKNITYRRVTEKGAGDEKVILIDQMGVMDDCYAHSKAVIMGGSFAPRIGGHNIYEALRHNIPVHYGPYMHGQQSILNSLHNHPFCHQIPLQTLRATLKKLLSTTSKAPSVGPLAGASKRSWEIIKQNL